MKKLALGLIALLVLFFVAACGDHLSSSPSSSSKKRESSAAESGSGSLDDEPNAQLETLRSAVYDVDAAPFFDLGLGLLRHVEARDGNRLISPVSLARPLAVVANGAKGQTLEELENVLSTQDLKTYDANLKALAAYWAALPEDTFGIADSVWVRKGYTLSAEYLSRVEEVFGASIFERPFDGATVDEINSWVNEHTHGMIPTLVSGLDPASSMVIADACAFEGAWQDPYSEEDVRAGDFTQAGGTVQEAQMMWDSKNCSYLENDLCSGFRKAYGSEGEFAFVGLLPKEGTTPEELLANLTGESLDELLRTREPNKVTTALPKFKGEYQMDLVEPLRALGLEDAFDENKADFSAMVEAGADSPWIGDALQKTFIEINEKGTKAAAATGLVAPTSALAPEDLEPKEVVLDRPFVYLILDTASNVALFMGTVGSLASRV